MDMNEIDLELFKLEEVIQIMQFFSDFEKVLKNKGNKKSLISSYRNYQSIINNKSLEKQYDKVMEEKTGVSIYKYMKSLQLSNKGESS